MDESFYIHLASNVQPETFPENNPTKFSTHLAEEIDMRGSGWEVAVKNITYPTTTSTVTSNDKLFFNPIIDKDRKFIARTPDSNGNYEPHKVVVPLQSVGSSRKIKSYNDIAPHVVEIIHDALGKLKDIIIFRYNKDKLKFIVDINESDIVLRFSPALQTYLGFDTRIIHTGTVWAWSKFDPHLRAVPHDSEDTHMFIYDLRHMKRISFNMKLNSASLISMNCDDQPCETVNQISYESDYKDSDEISYDISYSYKSDNKSLAFKDGKEVSEFMKSYLFSLNAPTGKFISIARKGKYDEYWKRKNKMKIEFVRINKPGPLKMKNLYWVNSTFPHFDFTPNVHDISKELPYLTIDVYINEFSNRNAFLEVDTTRSKQITSLKSQKPLTSPEQYLPLLNNKQDKFGHEFIFNKETNRFSLKIGNKFCVTMSSSLSSILGFTEKDIHSIPMCDSIMTASRFPLLDREINNLYVYSNIVETVFVGNVKAPLMLVCPLRKLHEKSKVHQVEFLNPTYTKLNRNTLRQIDIEIYDDAGEAVPFLYGKTILTLHFRKR